MRAANDGTGQTEAAENQEQWLQQQEQWLQQIVRRANMMSLAGIYGDILTWKDVSMPKSGQAFI